MSESVRHFLNEIPVDEMFEGDCYATNDPWKGTGHLHDITMVAPTFKDGTLVAFFACTAHVVDIGGRGFGADSHSVYEEGLLIPILKFIDQGRVNRDLVKIVRYGVREPDKVVGDFYSLAACNEVGHRRLLEMMNETGLDNLDELSFENATVLQGVPKSLNVLGIGADVKPSGLRGAWRLGYAGMEVDGEYQHAAVAAYQMRF